MIKLKTTKQGICSLIFIVHTSVLDIEKIRENVNTWERMETAAQIAILRRLKRRLQTKYVSLEDYPNTQKVTFSVDEMEAFLFVLSSGLNNVLSPFDRLMIERVKEPVCKQLLA